MNDSYADVQQSFNRCLQQREFLRHFYAVFTGRHAEIANRFRHTDWDRQTRLLRDGISSSILYAAGTGLGEYDVERLRESHGPGGHDIPYWMYEQWLESLIDALGDTDPRWDATLEARWREAMTRAIQRISGSGH